MEKYLSEFEYVLRNVMPDESLNDLIQHTDNLKQLHLVLDLKRRRISETGSGKVPLRCDQIYPNKEDEDIDLICSVLRNGLLVASNCDDLLSEIIKPLIKELNSTDGFTSLLDLKKLTTIATVCVHEKKDFSHFAGSNCVEELKFFILSIFEIAPQHVINFALVYFLPQYLFNFLIYHPEDGRSLLKIIFLTAKEMRKLDILCSLFDQFYNYTLNCLAFNIFETNDFWRLLESCITTSKTNSLRKQAVYLLSKSVYIILDNNGPYTPLVKLPDRDLEESRIGWKNFFVLLDVSSEKQLHLIEPSLQLFKSTRSLHPLWQICLLKMFLKHPQDSVVHFMVKHAIQSRWTIFVGVIQNVLNAINRNDYSDGSNKMFDEINKFSSKIETKEFEFIVQQSWKISWNPVALWSFYSSIFNKDSNFRLSVSAFHNTIKKVKSMPNVYIREGSIKLILDYFLKSFTIDSVDELEKVSKILLSINPEPFRSFIVSNEEKIISYKGKIQTELRAALLKKDFEKAEILLEICGEFHLLKSLDMIKNSGNSEMLDLIHSFPNFDGQAAQTYLLRRLSSVNDTENVTNLLRLCKNTDITSAIMDKAVNILENSRKVYPKNITIVAFYLLAERYPELYSGTTLELVDTWKYILMNSSQQIDSSIMKLFLQLLFKFPFDYVPCCKKSGIAQFFPILENVLDNDNLAALVIFKNISNIMKYTNNVEISCNFLGKCFDKVLNLEKNCLFKAATALLLEKVLKPEVLKHANYKEITLEFIENLFNSPKFKLVADVLSKNLANLTSTNPQISLVFVATIVELILHGIITTKTERTEYYVYEDISRKVELETSNPNLDEVGVRFNALDAMMNLVKSIVGDMATEKFVLTLIEKYNKNFNKRYFPQSEIHLQKLRILQALLFIYPYIHHEQLQVIQLILNSISQESHQPSIKQLMQLLLICLMKQDHHYFLLMFQTLQKVNHSRPSSVACLIPVLYHLALDQDEYFWDEIILILTPSSMGPQFKLRAFSQVAILKVYEIAIEKNYMNFVKKHEIIYNSIKSLMENSGNHLDEVVNFEKEFLDYPCFENISCSVIFYEIPKKTGVSVIEWANLDRFESTTTLKNIRFDHCTEIDDIKKVESDGTCNLAESTDNIQKKITPWRDILVETSRILSDFILVTSLVEKPANLGGLSRTCEVFGVQQLVMKTSKICTDKEFMSLSMSSENWVDIMEVKVEDLRSFIIYIKAKKYSVIGAEQTAESVKLDKFTFPKRTVLVLGNEKTGIPPNLIPTLDYCVEIPQFGVVRSLNVHVAGAIVMWQYCKQHLL